MTHQVPPKTSLSEYERISIKQIKYFWRPFYPKRMYGLDLINAVITANIKADVNFDPDREANYRTYRNTYAINAIKNYYKHSKTKKCKQKYNSISYLSRQKNEVVDINVVYKDKFEELVQAEEIINKELTEKEKQILYMRIYENKKLYEIAAHFKCSKQYIQQIEQKIKGKLQKHV